MLTNHVTKTALRSKPADWNRINHIITGAYIFTKWFSPSEQYFVYWTQINLCQLSQKTGSRHRLAVLIERQTSKAFTSEVLNEELGRIGYF